MTSVTCGNMYAGFDDAGDCFIYVGGRYYDYHEQIHLSREEAVALRDWLNKAVPKRKKCLRSRREGGRK